MLDQIEETAGEISPGREAARSCIGGEHLVTLGSLSGRRPGNIPDLHILHFDAHADLREDYLGVELSHACVLRRCWELLGDGTHPPVRHPLRGEGGVWLGPGGTHGSSSISPWRDWRRRWRN